MSDYRIVFNQQTGRYRVERRRLFGWAFVMDEAGEDYLTFADFDAARRFVCQQRRASRAQPRRWKVVDFCSRECPTADAAA